MSDIVKDLRAAASVLLDCPEHVQPPHRNVRINLHKRADEMSAAADEIKRLRATAAQLYDIAASGADPLERRRMLDRMEMESFAEDG